MATKFVLGYSGSLAYYDGKRSSGLKGYFWTYNHLHSDDSTRSAYYLFQAVKELHVEGKISPESFSMSFWGMIDARNKELAESLGIGHYLQVSGYLAKHESLAALASCSALFLPLESSARGEPLFIPGKLFEYIKVGKPIFALCEPDSDAGRIIQGSGLGIVSPPADIRTVKENLLKVVSAKDLSERYKTNAAYVEQFSWKETARKMGEIFDDLIKKV